MEEKSRIDLVILSPSTEVNKLTFQHLSTDTTVSELKRKISGVVPSQPSANQQRLIYRGHALLRGEATLKDVFSQEIVCLQSLEYISLPDHE